MAEQPEKKCDPEDLICQFQVLNYLEGMKSLLGTERFQEKYPEFKGLDDVVKERMSEQRTTIKEIMERCGIDTGGFVEEEKAPAETETTVEEE